MGLFKGILSMFDEKDVRENEFGLEEFIDNSNNLEPKEDSVKEVVEDKVEDDFDYESIRNKSIFPDFIRILKMSQLELKVYLQTQMEYFYQKENIIEGDGFLYVRGINPILLTSHMDVTPSTGGKSRLPIEDYYEFEDEDDEGNVYHTLYSPQGIGGDDRCGIWTILNILKETNYRPYILFCEDEEIGCIGSSKFTKTELVNELSNLKFLVEIDRHGNNDAVFYDDDNEEFHKWIEDVTGYKEAYGSCSDICNLSRKCKVSSLNLSCGYYDEHTTKETIVIEETLRTKDIVIKLIAESDKDETPQFEYKEKSFIYNNYYGYRRFYDNDYENYYKRYYSGLWDDDDDDNDIDTDDIDDKLVMQIDYIDSNGEEDWAEVEGNSELECWGQFFLDHLDVCGSDVIDWYINGLETEDNNVRTA